MRITVVGALTLVLIAVIAVGVLRNLQAKEPEPAA